MVDFLRSNTWCSQEHYIWGMSIPQIKLASCDFTHVVTLDKPEEETINIDSVEDLLNLQNMGIPII